MKDYDMTGYVASSASHTVYCPICERNYKCQNNDREYDIADGLQDAANEGYKEKEPTEDEFAEHVGRIIGKENSDDYILVETADLRKIKVWNNLPETEGRHHTRYLIDETLNKYLPEDK